jgi:hypothetical protein
MTIRDKEQQRPNTHESQRRRLEQGNAWTVLRSAHWDLVGAGMAAFVVARSSSGISARRFDAAT